MAFMSNELKRGVYQDKNGHQVRLIDIGRWIEEGGNRAVAIFETPPFDIPNVCFLKTFKETYTFVKE